MPIELNERKALSELKEKLSENYDIIDSKIYGSKARGSDSPGSDLDIMVVLKNKSSLIETEIDDLIYEINVKYDCFVTALYFGIEELETGPLSESPVYKRILQEGVSF